MPCTLKVLSALIPAAVVLLAAARAPADEPTTPHVAPTLAAPPDDLSGHLMLAPRVTWLVPMGSADGLTKQQATTGTGAAFGLDLAYGLSRYVDVHGRFDYGLIGPGSQCPAGDQCSARTSSVGLGVGYHLVNGAAFDPWMQIGLGYRTITFEHSGPAAASSKRTYSGFEWLHVAVGGEWYAARWLGFGPYLALDLGSYGSRPADAPPNAGSAFHTFLSLGIRGVIDPWR